MLPQPVISSRPAPSKMPRPWASQPGDNAIELVQSLQSDSTAKIPAPRPGPTPTLLTASRSAIDALVDRTRRYTMLLHLPDGYTPAGPRRMGGEDQNPIRGGAASMTSDQGRAWGDLENAGRR